MMGGMKGMVQKEDYCFVCKKWIDTDDPEHQEHEKLSNKVRGGNLPDTPLATLDMMERHGRHT